MLVSQISRRSANQCGCPLGNSSSQTHTCSDKRAVGRLQAKRNVMEDDLQTQHRPTFSEQETTLGPKAYHSLSSTSPSCLVIAKRSTVAAGSYGYGDDQTTEHNDAHIVGHHIPSLGPSFDLASDKASARLLLYAAVHGVGPLATAAQSLGVIGIAGSHPVYETLTHFNNWESLVLSTVSNAKCAAGSEKRAAKPGLSKSNNGDASQARKRKRRGRAGGDRSEEGQKEEKEEEGEGEGEGKEEEDGDDDNDNDDADDDGKEPKAKPKAKRRRTEKTSGSMLACPFAKKDPVRWQTCYRHRLTKISYVKQHLYRAHLQPLFCHRCGKTYAKQDDLLQHLRSTPPCRVRSFAEPEGITPQQRQSLSARLSSKWTDERRWLATFDIVFPDQPHPDSPYVNPDMSEDLSSFYQYMEKNGPQILADEQKRADKDRRTGQAAARSFEDVMLSGLKRIYSEWKEEREADHGHEVAAPASATARTPLPSGPRPQRAGRTIRIGKE